MRFLDRRIAVIAGELKRLSVHQRQAVTGLAFKRGYFLRPEEARADDTPFAPFDSRTMHWYGPDEHYWFAAAAEVPDAFAGKELWLHISTQIDERDDAKNPQFLLFVDGEIRQGVDMNHRDVLIARRAEAGRRYALDLQAYTGTLHTEFNLIIEWRQMEPELRGLYWDLQVPLRAFPRMDAQSQSRLALERVMNEAVNLLDLRAPYSESCMRSVGEARAYLAKHLYEELSGHDEVIATCIGHTHIDVAWWWTVEQTREKVCRSFATVLELMDEYPGYRFMSSQPQLYAFLKERYPELYAKVKARVAEGRWEPEGGMWVEADTNLTSGESLVRQFLHGKRFFREEFGVDSRICWLPDVFGYSGSLPQILKKCGIDSFMTTKLAWNQINQFPYDTFRWRGIDGTEVLAHLITTLGVGQDEKDYFTTYNGELHPDAILGGWRRYQNKEINNDILISFGYGDGGGGPTREMLETSIRMEKGIVGLPRVRQAFAGTYFDELLRRVAGNPRLPVWEGELYFEYHRGTLTSMARNKRSNRKAEIHMMDLELLSVLARRAVAYPGEALDRMWKTMLLNQFHDILPGSAIHEVYEVTRREYAALEEEMGALRAQRMAALAAPGEAIAVFNTKGFVSSEVVNLGDVDVPALADGEGNTCPVQRTEDGAYAFLPDLPAKGYRVFAPAGTREARTPFVLDGDRAIETPFYRAEFDADGLLARLYDRENDREVIPEGRRANLMRMYEDKPMNYDNWDIDIYYTEKYWDVTELSRFAWTQMGPVCAALETERKVSRSVIRQKIRFYADSRRIDFETCVDWHEHQHLLKVHFPLDVHTDEATFDVQFGSLTRKVHTNTSWDEARFESCGQKWIDLSEGHYGVSLLNDCKYGHSVRDGCVGLTLIKSGIVPNPTADQEEHVFTYALWPHAGSWREGGTHGVGGTVAEAYRLNQPALVWRGGVAGDAYSLASTADANVMLETVKLAEDGDGVILRVYETDNARTKTSLTFAEDIASVEECNLLEEKLSDQPFDGHTIPFAIRPYEVKTFRVRTR